MPFVFKNLIKQEVQDLKDSWQDGLLQEEFSEAEFVDLTLKHIEILNLFDNWFCLGRSATLSITDVKHLAKLGEKLQHDLKQDFPDKTGADAIKQACQILLKCNGN